MGSIEKLIERAEELAETIDFRLACHLVELAVQSEPEHPRERKEPELMSTGRDVQRNVH